MIYRKLIVSERLYTKDLLVKAWYIFAYYWPLVGSSMKLC